MSDEERDKNSEENSENSINERITELENKMNKLWEVEMRVLEELSLLRTRQSAEREEVSRLEHMVTSLIEELKAMGTPARSAFARFSKVLKQRKLEEE